MSFRFAGVVVMGLVVPVDADTGHVRIAATQRALQLVLRFRFAGGGVREWCLVEVGSRVMFSVVKRER